LIGRSSTLNSKAWMTSGTACIAIACALGFAPLVNAQDAPHERNDWNACGDEERRQWCRAQLRERGWVLKSEESSPERLQDSFWRIEVWVKGRDTLRCAMETKHGAMGPNGCTLLGDVPAEK
jgi:hypothetical protein